MLVNVKTNRILLDKSHRQLLNNKFILLRLRKNNNSSEFITKMSKDGRIIVPGFIRNELNLNSNDIVDVRVKELCQRIVTPKKFITDNNLDMLYFVQSKTMSGFDILTIEKSGTITSWYFAQGRPNEMKIKRIVPLEVIKFLGYLQAEGGKPKLRKRRGRLLDFTNKSSDIILDFLRISKFLFEPSLLHATILYNKILDKKELLKLEKILIMTGLNKDKITSRTSSRVKEFTIKLWISNSLLAETLFSAMNRIREYLTKAKLNSRNEYVFKFFIQGLMLGDGSIFTYRDREGSLHTRIQIFEQNKNYIEDYSKILKNIEINNTYKKDLKKNFYILTANGNWKVLLLLIKLDIFKGIEKSFNILKNSLKEHRKFRVLKYLIELPDSFSTSYFRKKFGLSYEYAISYLKSREEDGIISKIGLIKKENIWKLTNFGRDIKEIISNL